MLFVHVRLTKYRHSFNFNPTFPREHARLLQTVNQCQQCLSRLEVVLTVTRACKSGSSMLGGGHCQWEKGFLGCTKNSFIFKYWEKYHHRFATWFTVHCVDVLGCNYHDHRWIRCVYISNWSLTLICMKHEHMFVCMCLFCSCHLAFFWYSDSYEHRWLEAIWNLWSFGSYLLHGYRMYPVQSIGWRFVRFHWTGTSLNCTTDLISFWLLCCIYTFLNNCNVFDLAAWRWNEGIPQENGGRHRFYARTRHSKWWKYCCILGFMDL